MATEVESPRSNPQHSPGNESTGVPHVVILGAGFGGLGAMKKLDDAPIKVTVIDKNDYHTFLPLLYQVASAELSRNAVGFPIREMLHDHNGWEFHQANVTGIDFSNRTVVAEGIEPLSYDYLVVGLGAVANFYGTAGAAENAYPLYSMHDAVTLKKHILEVFEAVDKNPSLVDDGALRFCVIGGGATGVEISGALSELIRDELKNDYPNLPVRQAEVHLFEHGPHVLGPFKPNLQNYGKKQLEKRGVQVHLNEAVVAIEPASIKLKSGEEVKAHTLIWGAGIQANPIAGKLGQDLERGRIPVNLDLSLDGHPEVFVVGDMAMITDSKTMEKLPQLGSVALQAGSQAGENIERLVKGQQTEPFEYTDKGTMATIGHGAAIVQLPRGRTMSGRTAWMAWLGVHLVLLSGGEERSVAITDWGWSILTQKRGKRIVVD
jgi:NADH dehydrogenase